MSAGDTRAMIAAHIASSQALSLEGRVAALEAELAETRAKLDALKEQFDNTREVNHLWDGS